MRDLLYRKLAPAARAAFHARVGQALAEHFGGALEESDVEAIARHFVFAAQSGDAGPGVEWSLRAARLAADRGDLPAARIRAELGLTALAFAPIPDEAKRAELLAFAKEAVG